ncbi:hypothetical protein MMC08_004580 [Hypocenomyce scalaris]|nr:hypothetical protein [Hypocenomyce scalaris]
MAGILPTRGLPTLLAFLLLAISSTTSALNIAYCSSENTGSDFAGVTNHYQSNGACFDTCNGQYAFAILQGSECWCSDYVPADTTSTGSCNEPCPGYPSDLCGSSSGGLFGYIALSMSPSGTAGGSTSSTSSSAPSSALSLPSSNFIFSTIPYNHYDFNAANLVFFRRDINPCSSNFFCYFFFYFSYFYFFFYDTRVLDRNSVDAFFAEPFSDSESCDCAGNSDSLAVGPFLFLIFAPNAIILSDYTFYLFHSASFDINAKLHIYLDPHARDIEPALATGAPTVQRKSSGGLFSDTGKVVGLFIGIALIILIAAGLAIWLCVRRRRRNGEAATIASNAGNETPQRRPSRLSQMGLLGRTAGEKSLPAIQTSGWGPGISGDKSPDDTITPADGRRGSYPRIVDQRLDPVTVWNPLHDNGSHVSVRSFRDDQDYSRRMLRVANPDQ